MNLKKNILIILLLLSAAVNIVPQNFSTHYLHKKQFGFVDEHQAKKISEENSKIKIISSLDKKSNLNKIVFGYLPYWEYLNSRQFIRYNLLSHIALFDFYVSANGAITNPPYWPWTDVINLAKQNGVKTILCATNFNDSLINIIIRTPTVYQNFFNNLKNIITQHQLDGVNIDFEGLKTIDRGAVFNSFMAELKNYFTLHLPGKEISFAGPAVNWGGHWNFGELKNHLDFIFVMGYDFYGSWSTNAGPSAPLLGDSYNVTNSINVQYAAVVNSNPEKLVLGVPYYGNRWITRTDAQGERSLRFVSSTRFRNDDTASLRIGYRWSNTYKTPWYSWRNNDTSWFQVWFDDDSSLALKYDLARAKNLGGIGMWALGYDGDKPDLWNKIHQYLNASTNINDDDNLEYDFILSQNFPNPFNATTVIRYQLPASGFISLKIFDLLGNEIETIINQEQQAGFYQIDFNSQNLSSGIYFYRLTLHGKNLFHSSTHKMVLTK